MKITALKNLTVLNRFWGIVILCAVFYFVPISNVFATILVADPFWVTAGVFFQILLRILTSLKMQTLANAQCLDTGLFTMIRIVFTTTFYNLLAPGALIGGAVTYVKYLQHGIKSVAAAANIFANKYMELIILSLSAPLFWLIDKNYSPHLILIYGLTMVIGFYSSFSIFFGRFGNIQWIVSKINHNGQSVVHRTLVALCQQVIQIGTISHKDTASLIAYSAMHYFFAALAIICFGKALNFEVGLLPILWIYPVIYLLGMLPISISNIGVREVSMIMLLAPYGVPSTEATAWSVLMYCGPLSCAIIGLILEVEYSWLRKESGRATDSANDQVAKRWK